MDKKNELLTKDLIERLSKYNMPHEELVDMISDFDVRIIEDMILVCVINGNKKMEKIVKEALKIQEITRLKSFIEAINNGKEEEFLSALSWDAIHSLKFSIEYYDLCFEDNEFDVSLLKKLKERYLVIIEKSIDKNTNYVFIGQDSKVVVCEEDDYTYEEDDYTYEEEGYHFNK